MISLALLGQTFAQNAPVSKCRRWNTTQVGEAAELTSARPRPALAWSLLWPNSAVAATQPVRQLSGISCRSQFRGGPASTRRHALCFR